MRHAAPCAPALLALALAACGHSEPFTTTDPANRGPFSAASPLRLTYAGGTDLMPSFSADGEWIVHTFARGTTDRDRCVAILPATGGTRRGEVCPLPLEGAGVTDAFSFPALGAGDQLVANRHANNPTSPAPSSGTWQLVRADSTGGRTAIWPLMAQPPGGTRPWTYLVTPAWVADDRVVAIAAEHAIGSWNPFAAPPPGPYDTLYVGSAVVEFTLEGATPTWRTVAALPGAAMIAADATAGWLYVIVPTERTPGLNIDAARVADTLWRVPLAGGPPEPIWGAPRAASELVGGVVGLAAGGGKIFLSEARGEASGGRPAGSTTTIRELMPDGSFRLVATAPGALPGRFGRIAASPDGRTLVAELHTAPGQADLYLIPTGP